MFRTTQHARRCTLAAVCGPLLAATAHAQQPKFQSAPATDSSAQASPIVAPASAPKPTDNATQSSPEIGPSTATRGVTLRPGTAIPIKLARAIDSGKLKNGDTVPATLTSAVKTSSGTTLAAGSHVAISVIATVPAGKLNAAGEFSLQAMRVGSVGVFTDIQTFRGDPGHKDLPDSAPAVGTDAGLAAGAELTFHVQKPPTAADAPPKQGVATPGSVNGHASGSAPPPGSDPSAKFDAQSQKSAQQIVAPADNSFQSQGKSTTTSH